MQERSLLIYTLLLLLSTMSCGGDAGPGDSDTDTGSVDAMTTAEGLTAFLAAETHRGEGWRSETVEPREESTLVSPHDHVRVFFNDTLVSSQRAGNGEYQGTPHTAGSMAVKELYEENTVVGYAIIYQEESNSLPESTVYYCVGPEGRCLTEGPAFPEDAPAFGRGLDIGCGGCHGSMVFTVMP